MTGRLHNSADEMVDGRGGLRPHWRQLVGVLSGLGPDVLAERALRLERAFAEDGASGLPSPRAGSWRCDPIPLLLTQPEFTSLEAGLAQRARLLEATLADLYGPQTLLAEGVLPPALVLANPGFLRPLRSAGQEPRGPLLQFYAADLVRGPDRQWRVMADHIDSTSGIARALENRRMMARVLPELFPPMQIGQISPFFEIWQDALERMAPPGSSPGIALLTGGHADPMWFEHVLLSRELSCALVEGGDLTVRGGGLFLKTLRGLQPVNVLLRRMRGEQIDPLELSAGHSKGPYGVPGLLDVMRNGAVRVVNHPGAGLAKAPGLAAFLPALCQRLLGEKLAMRSLPSSWLGEDGRADAVLAAERIEPGSWYARSALERGPQRPILELEDAIRAEPWRFVGTEALPPSVAPCVVDGGMEPRSVMLRMFLVFDGHRWQAMQGGLALTLPDASSTVSGPNPLPPGQTLANKTLAKDVWVMLDDTAEIRGPSHLDTPVLPVRRTAGDLPSRVADNFYWLGRYLERAENAARLQRAVLSRLSRATLLPRENAELRVLLAALAHAGVVDATVADSASAGAIRTDIMRASRNSVLLSQVSDMADKLRDRLTGDMYAAVTSALPQLQAQLRAARAEYEAGHHGEGMEALAHVMTLVLHFTATVAGLAAENMVRGGGRLFLDLGRRVERAQAVASLVALALRQPPVRGAGFGVGQAGGQPGRIEAGLRMALELCDSVITYRNRYLTVLQPAPVLDLVLADEGNPRSLAFQLAAARDLLAEIARDPQAAPTVLAATLLNEASALVRDVTLAGDQSAAAAALPPRLEIIEQEVASLSDRIGRLYFALLPTARTVGVDASADADQALTENSESENIEAGS